MRNDQRSAGQSLVNVQTFIKSTPEVASLADTPAGKQLDAAIVSLDTSVADQASAGLDASVHRQRIADLSKTLVQEYMKPTAQFARTSLRGSGAVADFAALGKVVRARAGKKLAAYARAMATAATPVSAAFAAAKFDPDFITKLGSLAGDLAGAIDARSANKARGVQATEGIGIAINSGREAVRMLDPVVTRMLKGTKLLAAWQSVKRVRKAPSTTVGAVPPAAAPTAAAAVTAAITTHQEVKAS